MKKIRRVTCTLLCVMMIISLLPFNSVAAGGSGSEDWDYYISDEGVEIHGCYLTDEEIVVPSTLEGIAVTKIYGLGASIRYAKTLTIPDTVTEITAYALSDSFDNIPLEELNIGAGVTEMESDLFLYCNNLKRVNVSSVNANYKSVDGVVFTKDMTTLVCYPAKKSEAFVLAASVQNICTIPVGAKLTSESNSPYFSIRDGIVYDKGETKLIQAFDYTDGTVLASTLKTICESAFAYTDLTMVVIPENVTAIEDYAFYDCVNLKSVSFPAGLKSIGGYAFKDCYSLETLSLPSGLKTVESFAFADCTSLSSITIPNGMTEIEQGVFDGCVNVVTLNIPNSITSIGQGAFYGCLSLVHVTVPDSVTKIDTTAFYKCTGLKSIDLSENLTEIDFYTFTGCTSLESIVIPDKVKRVDYHAFKDCTSLNSIVIPDDLTVGEDAFFNTGHYRDQSNWANGVLYVGKHLVNAAKNITECTVREGTKTVADSAFIECRSLTSISMPTGMTYIGEYAFRYCTNLERIDIPMGVTRLSDDSFSHCLALETVTIPNSVTEIGYSVFYGCYSLETINIPDSVTLINSSAIYETALYQNDANWQNGVLYIDNHFIAADTAITACTIREGTKTIAGSAFCDCADLETVSIPKSVKSIGDNAFYGCSSLSKVIYSGTVKDKKQIFIDIENERLIKASWNCVPCDVHEFDNACDATCDCGFTRTTTHKYDNAFDSICNICGYTRTAPNTPTKVFTDIKSNDWFKSFVDYAVAYGMFNGTGNTTFSPNTDMTRAQFVQVLANLSDVSLDNSVSSGFTDVASGQWYTGAVKWAVENGVASGVGNGRFDPNGKVTREQMCVMLVNYIENHLGMTLEITTDSTFADDANIASWAKVAVYKCFSAGLVSGTGNNKFSPKVIANRAQGATIFTNFHKVYIK